MSKTPAQILVEASPALDRFMRKSVRTGVKRGRPAAPNPKKSELHREHQATYRERRKQGLQPLQKPWGFLCSGEVKDMAWQAYRVASWYMREDVQQGSNLTPEELREAFASSLAEMFSDAVMAHAVSEGGCWPVDGQTPPHRNYPRVWELLKNEVPASWRPEYPLYKEVAPAERCSAPGAVINVDEGNANDAHSSQ